MERPRVSKNGPPSPKERARTMMMQGEGMKSIRQQTGLSAKQLSLMRATKRRRGG